MKNILPSQFFRRLGFTSMNYMGFPNIDCARPLKEMHATMERFDMNPCSEDTPVFYHPRIKGKRGYDPCWTPLFLIEGALYLTNALIRTNGGFSLDLMRYPERDDRQIFTLEELSERNAKPVLDAKFHPTLIVKGGQEVILPIRRQSK